jgi:hypothetical protein
MKNNWTALLTLGISLSWMVSSTTAYARQGTERVYSSAASSLSSLLPARLDAVNVSSQTLAQSVQRPRANTSAQRFGDVTFYGTWRIDDSEKYRETGTPGGIHVLLAPGPVQFDLANANVPKNYRLKARITVFDQLFDPKPIKTCWMNFNPASPDTPCVLDTVRPAEIIMYAKWLGGPKPKRKNNRNFGEYWQPGNSPFSDSPGSFYYLEGNSRPLYSIIKNARRAKFEFPATPKPKEEDTRRCWRNISGMVVCW